MSGERQLKRKKRSANCGTGGSDLSQQLEQKIVPPSKKPRVAETRHDLTGCNELNPTKSVDGIALEISVAKYAQSRAKELETLSQAIEWEGTKLSFQRLPRHMRRRAMSHDIRRIPRRLRLRAQAELEKREKKGESKRPSRRHRRRPSNLLSEYQRRQRQNVWLETHIWHAKRFKMSTVWGYRLPMHPSDKSLRACYRASTHHCLLQDVSYEGCIEIKGHLDAICSALSHVCSKKGGLTFEAKASMKGERWGKVMLYQWDSYPHSPVAPVTFLWQASSRSTGAKSGDDCKETTTENKLWIWVHPSAYAEVLTLLKKACTVRQCLGTIGSTTELSVLSQHPPIELRSLKDQLVKFRLTGPASNLILDEVLKPANPVQSAPPVMYENFEEGPEEIARLADMTAWWQVYYSEKEHKTAFEAQKKTFQEVFKRQSSDEIPPCIVLALTVQDPRVLRPAVRKKIDVQALEVSSLTAMTWKDIPALSTVSPLWEDHVREEVSKSKMSDLEMNKARSQMLVPGSVLDLGTKESCVPVLLLHRPGSQLAKKCKHTATAMRAGVDAGWDLILPKGWSMAFWLALVYKGARVGGLREARSISTRSSALHFPHDFVDTEAGHRQAEAACEELIQRYVRRPPAKRVNYSRIGVVSPFTAPFMQLEMEWQGKLKDVLNCEPGLHTNCSNACHQQLLSGGAEGVMGVSEDGNGKPVTAESKAYILRCRKLLKWLREMVMCSCHAIKRNANFIKRKACSASSGRDLSVWLQKPENADQIAEHRHSLVPVSVSCPHRGVPSARAMICLPSEEDARKLKEDPSFGGPVEHLHPKCRSKERGKATRRKKSKSKVTSEVDGTDQNLEQTRKSRSTEITTKSNGGTNTQRPLEAGQLKSVEIENSGKKSITSTCRPDISATQKVVKVKTSKAVLSPRQVQEKEELLQAPKMVIDSADRLVIGFLTDGDFDLGQGHGSGIGLCSLVGLLTALNCPYLDRPLLVLIRNPSSRQYRFAYLSIIY